MSSWLRPSASRRALISIGSIEGPFTGPALPRHCLGEGGAWSVGEVAEGVDQIDARRGTLMDLLEGLEAHLIIIDRRTHHVYPTFTVRARTARGRRLRLKPLSAIYGPVDAPETITLTRPLSDVHGDLRPAHVNDPDTTKKGTFKANAFIASDEVLNLITRFEDAHPGRERSRDTTKIRRMDDGTVSSHGDHLSGGADWSRARFSVPRSFHALLTKDPRGSVFVGIPGVSVAVALGFEPRVAVTPHSISSAAPSAARTRYQWERV